MIIVNTGVTEACPVSVFIHSVCKLSIALLTVVGMQHSIEHGIMGVWEWNHTIFCDDLTLFAQMEENMQTLLSQHF
jgi:hypothetical protein